MSKPQLNSIRVIDYDRGVIINHNEGLGMDVFMYVDKPGEYLSAHGHSLPESVAEQSGFDVKALKKDRERLEKRRIAMDAIDKEFAEEQDELAGEEDVVKEEGGFKIVNIGKGRYFIKDAEGNRVHDAALDKVKAENVLSSLLNVKTATVAAKSAK